MKLARETWKKFAVSGSYNFDTGEANKRTDVDGRSALGLFKLAGFDTSDTAYLLANAPEPGRIHVDMGEKDGFIVKDGGRTAYFDHHSPNSKRGSSATEQVYKTLLAMGALKREPALERLVEFVNQEDNRSYKKEAEYFKDSYRTVLGLSRFMSFEKLYDFFKSRRQPDTILTKAEIEQLGLTRESNNLKMNIEQSQERIRELEKNGFVIKSPKYGKVIIDIRDEGKEFVTEGFRAAKAHGAGGFLIWSPGKNQSMFFSTVDTPITFKLPQGKLLRETMWIKPPNDKSPLRLNLEELINTITDRTYRPTGQLAEYLRSSASSAGRGRRGASTR